MSRCSATNRILSCRRFATRSLELNSTGSFCPFCFSSFLKSDRFSSSSTTFIVMAPTL